MPSPLQQLPPRQAPPPDLTNNTGGSDRGHRYEGRNAIQSHAHAQSVRVTQNAVTGLDYGDGDIIHHGKVSDKIKQLLNTLKVCCHLYVYNVGT